MKLSEKLADELRDMTVAWLLELRADYLGTPGANVLKHWDQIADRMRARTYTCAHPAEWATKLMQDLRIPTPGPRSSSCLLALTGTVDDAGVAHEWLDLVAREHGYLMAQTRVLAEGRRATREAASAAKNKEKTP